LATEVASLVESGKLEVEEEDVFAAVMAWVKEDEAGRKAELVRLLPLVRFPMMAGGATAINTEPLVVAQQPLAFQLLFETQASGIRHKPRRAHGWGRERGSRKGRQPMPKLAFTRVPDCMYCSIFRLYVCILSVVPPLQTACIHSVAVVLLTPPHHIVFARTSSRSGPSVSRP
jgi:hypothetical protein